MIQHIADHTITDKHGMTFEVVSRFIHLEIEYCVYHGDKCIALAELPHQHARYCSNVFTDRAWRRRGIATALYDLIERVHNITLRPSHILLPDGEAFWCARDASRISSHRYTVINEDLYHADLLALR